MLLAAACNADEPPTGDAPADAGVDGPPATDAGQATGEFATCIDDVAGALTQVDDQLFEAEIQAREEFLRAPIAITGRVIDAAGVGIAGATVEVTGCELTVETGPDGRFAIPGLGRHNRTLTITAAGYRPEVTYAKLFQPVTVADVELAPIELVAEDPGTVRFLYGGDVAFARRFLDPFELYPPDQIPPATPEALIQSDDPLPGTMQAMAHVRPQFLKVDYPIVNLESPVLTDTSTPHTNKDFIFFTLPGSLGVFDWLNVQYVALGNNHLYDFLDLGVIHTLTAIDAAGLAHSGAGPDLATALVPHVEQLGGTEYALLSMTSVAGTHAPPLFVASDDKGGAADMRDDQVVQDTVADALSRGHVPIVQAHTGQEYTYSISDYAYDRMTVAAQAGAPLVVGHHPHVAQGFSYIGQSLLIHSLGNLCFDQERLETMLALMAQIDMRGDAVEQAEAIPIYLEDFRPRPVVGRLSETLLRRIGRASSDRGGVAYPWSNRARVAQGEADVARASRMVTIPITVPGSGATIVDLRRHAAAHESVAGVSIDQPGAMVQLGEDLMLHGDMEDNDVDDEIMEVARWDVEEPSVFVCLDQPYEGAAAACLRRDDSDSAPARMSFRNRIRVLGNVTLAPNKDLSFYAYLRGDNAGPINITAQYYASEGFAEFGGEVLIEREGGTFPWMAAFADLNMPADIEPPEVTEFNPRAVRLFFRLRPPDFGTGVLAVDAIAVISWEPALDLAAPVTVTAPNPIDFLRVDAPAGDYQLTVTFETQAPR